MHDSREEVRPRPEEGHPRWREQAACAKVPRQDKACCVGEIGRNREVVCGEQGERVIWKPVKNEHMGQGNPSAMRCLYRS